MFIGRDGGVPKFQSQSRSGKSFPCEKNMEEFCKKGRRFTPEKCREIGFAVPTVEQQSQKPECLSTVRD